MISSSTHFRCPSGLAALILVATVSVAAVAGAGAEEQGATIDITGWERLFAFHYDYVLEETAGFDREAEPVEVTMDHPFIFIIRDIETGAILFVGRVVNPSA